MNHKGTMIETRITAILVGSGLPIERRAEVAEELRGHLEQLVMNHCAAGLSDERAIEAALAEFGPPELIRKQLRRQQRTKDWRSAIEATRRDIRMPFAFCVMMGAAAAFKETAESLLMHTLAGISVFVCLFFGFVLPLVVVFFWCERQAKRRLPRPECHFLKCFLKWTLTTATVLAGLGASAAVMFGVSTSLLEMAFWLNLYPWFLLDRTWDVFWYSSGRVALSALGIGLVIALYERSRCIAGLHIEAPD